jgi:hypothetical protein
MCRSGSEKQNLSKQEQIVVAFSHTNKMLCNNPQLKYNVMSIWEMSLQHLLNIHVGSLQKLCLNSSAANSWLWYVGLDEESEMHSNIAEI